MRLVLISDTHSQHDKVVIPECDVLVHAGDYSQVGSPQEIASFYSWLCNQTQAKHKVFIEGNHDMHADPTITTKKFTNTASYADFQAWLPTWNKKFEDANIHRLLNSEVVIDGVKFYGSPYTIAFHGWGFNSTLDELQENWKSVPEDTDVLITHGPPLGKLDRCMNGHRAGDPWLMQKVIEIKPKIHVFGHIHESSGMHTIGIAGETQTTLFNASMLDESYDLSNQPILAVI